MRKVPKKLAMTRNLGRYEISVPPRLYWYESDEWGSFMVHMLGKWIIHGKYHEIQWKIWQTGKSSFRLQWCLVFSLPIFVREYPSYVLDTTIDGCSSIEIGCTTFVCLIKWGKDTPIQSHSLKHDRNMKDWFHSPQKLLLEMPTALDLWPFVCGSCDEV